MNPQIKKIMSFISIMVVLAVGSFLVDYFNEQNRNIRNCVKSSPFPSAVGLEFSCAINEAAKIYDQDKEKAIKLCMDYSISPGDSINKSFCEISIKEKLKNKQ